MNKPKIIALICIWASEQWIVPLLKEVSEQCDEIMINVSSHSENLKQFEDNTYNIVKDFMKINKNIHYVELDLCSYHAIVKANILNKMLAESKCINENSWLWIRDSDEFYTEDSYNKIKQTIEEDKYDSIRTNEKYFYINMSHYLKNSRCRLRKLKDTNRGFFPTQQWRYPTNELFIKDAFMFHYGILNNFESKMEFWKSEYPNDEQNIKVEWLDKIYRNYDLNNEEYWINKNEELFGIKSPWFSDSFKPQNDGTLFKYKGKHPKYVRHLENINDFRI